MSLCKMLRTFLCNHESYFVAFCLAMDTELTLLSDFSISRFLPHPQLVGCWMLPQHGPLAFLSLVWCPGALWLPTPSQVLGFFLFFFQIIIFPMCVFFHLPPGHCLLICSYLANSLAGVEHSPISSLVSVGCLL